MASPPSTFWLLVPQPQKILMIRIDGTGVHIETAEQQDDLPLARSVSRHLAEHGYDGEPVLMGLNSRDVLAVPLPSDPESSHDKGNYEALLYELEEFVPLSAEQFTADISNRKEHRFAVLVENALLELLLDELDQAGVFVQNIVPLAAIVAQSITEHFDLKEGILAWLPDEKTLFPEESVELFFLTGEGPPFRWHLIGTDPVELHRVLDWEFSRQERTFPVSLCRLPESLREVFAAASTASDQITLLPETDTTELLAAMVPPILTGKTTPWWDLRRHTLAVKSEHRLLKRSVQTLLWSGVLFLAAFCFSCFIQGYRFNQVTRQSHSLQKTAFTEALPGQNLETGFRNRLESEYRKMSAQRENVAGLPLRGSVLVPLLHLLEALPAETRYRFPEIRIERNQIRMNGQLQVHSDAEVVASALQQVGFTVEPPATQQDHEQGVSVRLVMQLAQGTTPGGKSP